MRWLNTLYHKYFGVYAFILITLVISVLGMPNHVSAGHIYSSSVTVTESAKVARFTLTFKTYDQETSYTYNTVDGTAVAPGDYTKSTDAPLVITYVNDNPVAYVDVPIVNDAVHEPTEAFSIEVYSGRNGVLEGIWTATIEDDDPAPVVTPQPVIPQPRPRPTLTPTPTPTPTPVLEPTTTQPVEPVTPVSEVLGEVTPTASPPSPPEPNRSEFVKSIPDPSQLSTSPRVILTSLAIAVLLVLLIAFPADMFNSTLQSNYDEIAGWFKIGKTKQLTEALRKLPTPISVGGFAIVGALLNSQLSPGFGWNQASLALLIGMIITIIIAVLVYDLSRAIYLRHRYKVPSKLRVHVLGLFAGGFFVLFSRLSNFLPGYFYGLFTGLVYGNDPADEQDGEGLAISATMLLVLAAIGWFSWIPVKAAAVTPGAGLPILILDATLASLWVSALSAIVFALIPLRFMYGEQVKKWSKKGWTIIYGLGMSLFVYTLIHPGQGFYGTSDKTNFRAVLSLFLGFGLFSLLFWGYFRYRPLWQGKKLK